MKISFRLCLAGEVGESICQTLSFNEAIKHALSSQCRGLTLSKGQPVRLSLRGKPAIFICVEGDGTVQLDSKIVFVKEREAVLAAHSLGRVPGDPFTEMHGSSAGVATTGAFGGRSAAVTRAIEAALDATVTEAFLAVQTSGLVSRRLGISGPIVVVHGPRGVGTSALARALSKKLWAGAAGVHTAPNTVASSTRASTQSEESVATDLEMGPGSGAAPRSPRQPPGGSPVRRCVYLGADDRESALASSTWNDNLCAWALRHGPGSICLIWDGFGFASARPPKASGASARESSAVGGPDEHADVEAVGRFASRGFPTVLVCKGTAGLPASLTARVVARVQVPRLNQAQRLGIAVAALGPCAPGEIAVSVAARTGGASLDSLMRVLDDLVPLTCACAGPLGAGTGSTDAPRTTGNQSVPGSEGPNRDTPSRRPCACEIGADDVAQALSTVSLVCESLGQPPLSLSALPPARWADIGGYAEIKASLVEFAQWPQSRQGDLARFHVSPPAGVFLFGPSGCGKTLLLRALAAECGLACFHVSGPALLSGYLGESERAVRELFQQARSLAPALVILDELDAIVGSRDAAAADNGNGGSSVHERMVTQVLTELDGFHGRGGVLVAGCSSRPGLVDKAVLRPGRLEKHLLVGRPDAAERAQILGVCLERIPTEASVETNHVGTLPSPRPSVGPSAPSSSPSASTSLPTAKSEGAEEAVPVASGPPGPAAPPRSVSTVSTASGLRAKGIDIQEAVEVTEGMSGADLMALTRDAAILALRANGAAAYITQQNFDQALDAAVARFKGRGKAWTDDTPIMEFLQSSMQD